MSLISLDALIKQKDLYCKLLKEELYFEAHEALEALWFEHRLNDDKEVRLIRAYINAAVSFELIKRGRPKASLKPWGFFERNFELIQHAPQKHKIHYLTIYEKILETSLHLAN